MGVAIGVATCAVESVQRILGPHSSEEGGSGNPRRGLALVRLRQGLAVHAYESAEQRLMIHPYDTALALMLDMATRALCYFGVKARRLLAAEIRVCVAGHAGRRLDALMGGVARLALIRELLVRA